MSTPFPSFKTQFKMTLLIIRYNLWYYNVLLVNFVNNIFALYLKSFSGSLLVIRKGINFYFRFQKLHLVLSQSSISLLKFSTFLPILTIFSSKFSNIVILSSCLLIHTSRSCLCLLMSFFSLDFRFHFPYVSQYFCLCQTLLTKEK